MSVVKGTASGGAIAVIGDLHSAWEPEDVGYFNRADYPVVLVTGDLGRSGTSDGRHIARSLMRLAPEVLVMPGNNDVDEYPHICAELTYRRARADLLADTSSGDADVAGGAEHTRLCGFSLHPLTLNGLRSTILAARPFSLGGPELGFPDALERAYGVRTMAQSIERLRALVDAVTTEYVVFLAHNGPSGLGAQSDDIWGRDFPPRGGDWGDPDLRVAVDYAQQRGLRVLAVIAGHMHWQAGEHARVPRRWQLSERGVLYVNSARVPRIFSRAGASVRHHLRVQLSAQGASVEERLVVDGRD